MKTSRPRKPPFLLPPPGTRPSPPRYGRTAPSTSTKPPVLLPTDTATTGGPTHTIHKLLLTLSSTPTFQDDHSLGHPPCQTPNRPHPPTPRPHPYPTNLPPSTTHTPQQTQPFHTPQPNTQPNTNQSQPPQPATNRHHPNPIRTSTPPHHFPLTQTRCRRTPTRCPCPPTDTKTPPHHLHQTPTRCPMPPTSRRHSSNDTNESLPTLHVVPYQLPVDTIPPPVHSRPHSPKILTPNQIHLIPQPPPISPAFPCSQISFCPLIAVVLNLIYTPFPQRSLPPTMAPPLARQNHLTNSTNQAPLSTLTPLPNKYKTKKTQKNKNSTTKTILEKPLPVPTLHPTLLAASKTSPATPPRIHRSVPTTPPSPNPTPAKTPPSTTTTKQPSTPSPPTSSPSIPTSKSPPSSNPTKNPYKTQKHSASNPKTPPTTPPSPYSYHNNNDTEDSITTNYIYWNAYVHHEADPAREQRLPPLSGTTIKNIIQATLDHHRTREQPILLAIHKINYLTTKILTPSRRPNTTPRGHVSTFQVVLKPAATQDQFDSELYHK